MELQQIKVFEDSDIEILSKLADEIYHEHYITIITKEQIDYMVDLFLSPQALKQAIEEEGYDYFMYRDGDDYVAFFGIEPARDDAFLSKLYVRKDCRGKGIGAVMMRDIEDYCREKGLSSVWLTCNKYNSGSLAFYDRMGFEVEREQCADIGNGYVMDDYVLRLTFGEADEGGADEGEAVADGASGPKPINFRDKEELARAYEEHADEIERLPRFNIGAIVCPALWGPLHGFWVALLYYPIWVFVDSCIRAAVITPSGLSISLAAIALIATIASSIFLGFTCEPRAYLSKVEKRGIEKYLKNERIWAIVCIVFAIAAIALGTYYNLAVYIPAHT
ncbi:MAG: GNAT family N-acetyltransferase [bacterium]|nr:GNAT family N-acetyltransferase [bacterium]